jgi:hypothetical protein
VHSKGNVPVAILSNAAVDAPNRVDRSSLTFGRLGTEASLAFCSSRPKDVNGDGLPDLICYFRKQQLGFEMNDTHAVINGKTVDGIPFIGTDSVSIVDGDDSE